jgi:hypothetical protein
MKLKEGGREHAVGDTNCAGCESIEGERRPRPHRDESASCRGLVHAKRFGNIEKKEGVDIRYRCDVCGEGVE